MTKPGYQISFSNADNVSAWGGLALWAQFLKGSSDQRFASGFFQIPPRGGHPCRQLWACRYQPPSGLSPVRLSAMPGTHRQRLETKVRAFYFL